MKRLIFAGFGLILVGVLLVPAQTQAQVSALESLRSFLQQLNSAPAPVPMTTTQEIKPLDQGLVSIKFKIGDSGEEVRKLQEKLKVSGDFTYPEITGYYGKATDEAVKKYETRTREIIYKPIPTPRPLPVPPVGGTGSCTADAKQCPDGSYVGRVSPSCEFRACPATPVSPAGEITVLSPNGGESWLKGQKQIISWVWKGDVGFVDVTLYPVNAGRGVYPVTLGYHTPNSGNLVYFLSDPIVHDDIIFSIPDGQYSIGVCESGTKNCDTSDSYFTISSRGTVPPPSGGDITVLSPNGGEALLLGKTHEIRWSSNTRDKVLIYLTPTQQKNTTCYSNAMCANGLPAEQVLLASLMPNTGSYFWEIGTSVDNPGATFTGSYYVRVCTLNYCDASDSYFKVYGADSVYPRPDGNQPPVIHGISGPIVLKVGEMGEWSVKASDPENGSLNYKMAWGDELNGANPLSSSAPAVVIEPVRQTSTFYHVYSQPGTYTPTFVVSDEGGNRTKANMTVRVGDGAITWPVPQGSIQVISPNGGEALLAYSNTAITWKSPGAKVDLYLQPDWSCPAGYSCPAVMPEPYLLDKNISGDAYYWIVATDINNKRIPNGSYKVEICPAGSDLGCDSSDNSFKIYSGDVDYPTTYGHSPTITMIYSKASAEWEIYAGREFSIAGTNFVVPDRIFLGGKQVRTIQDGTWPTGGALYGLAPKDLPTGTSYVYVINGNGQTSNKVSVKTYASPTGDTITIDPIVDESAAGVASVKVVSTTGKTVTNAKVSLHTTSGRAVRTGDTASGEALFENLPYGSYLAYAKADGYAPARAKVTISEKKPKASVTIKLKKEKDETPPKVVTVGIVSSNPPSGAIDARMPSNANGSGFWQGWNQFGLWLSGVASADLEASDFVLKTTGGNSTPINNVTVGDDGLVTLTTQYGVPIPEGERTVIRHQPTGTEVCLGYLPGDVDGSGKVDGADLLSLLDVINGVKTLPNYSTDLNRDGVTNSEDQLTWIDLTNGADAYSAWFGQSLPSCPRV